MLFSERKIYLVPLKIIITDSVHLEPILLLDRIWWIKINFRSALQCQLVYQDSFIIKLVYTKCFDILLSNVKCIIMPFKSFTNRTKIYLTGLYFRAASIFEACYKVMGSFPLLSDKNLSNTQNYHKIYISIDLWSIRAGCADSII